MTPGQWVNHCGSCRPAAVAKTSYPPVYSESPLSATCSVRFAWSKWKLIHLPCAAHRRSLIVLNEGCRAQRWRMLSSPTNEHSSCFVIFSLKSDSIFARESKKLMTHDRSTSTGSKGVFKQDIILCVFGHGCTYHNFRCFSAYVTCG